MERRGLKEGGGTDSGRIIFALVSIFFVLLYFQIIDDSFSDLRGGDTSSYVLLAKSLATGEGFSDVNLPSAPPHTQYPPFFPLMLAPVFALFGYNFMWMRLVVILSALASLYAIRLYFRDVGGDEGDLPGRGGLVTVLLLLTGTNFYVLFFSKEILPEIPYLFLSLIALLGLRRYAKGERLKGALFLLPLLIPIAFFTKLVGAALCVAGILFFALRAVCASPSTGRREDSKKLGYFALLALVPLAGWMLRNSIYSSGVATYQSIFVQSDYYDVEGGTAGFGALAARAADNLLLYAREVPKSLLTYLDLKNILHPAAFKFLLLLVLALVLLGLFSRLFKKRGVAEFYVTTYLAILVVWPVYGSGDARRYLVPLIPFLYFYLLSGLGVLASLRRTVGAQAFDLSISRRAILLPVLFFLFLNAMELKGMIWPPSAAGKLANAASVLSGDLLRKVSRPDPAIFTNPYFQSRLPCYHRYIMEAELLGRVAPSGSLIMTRKHELVHIISDRHTVRYPFTADTAVMLEFAGKVGVTHLLIDGCYEETRNYLVPFVSANEDRVTTLKVGGEATGIMAIRLK